jgi:hypothetical protein
VPKICTGEKKSSSTYGSWKTLYIYIYDSIMKPTEIIFKKEVKGDNKEIQLDQSILYASMGISQ